MKIYCAFLILGIILYSNFTLTLKIRLDVYNLKAYAILSVWRLRLLRLYAFFSKLSGKFRVFIKIFSKTVFFNINKDKNDENSMANFADFSYKPTVDVKNIHLSLLVGVKGDAMLSTILYAFSERLLLSGVKYVYDTQEVGFSYRGDITNESKFETFAVVSINISLAIIAKEIIYFFALKIISKLKSKTKKKEKFINDNRTKGQTIRAYDAKLVRRN